jgi:hypothetical protein
MHARSFHATRRRATLLELAGREQAWHGADSSATQRGIVSLPRVGEDLEEERTACINQIRGVPAEFALVFGKSAKGQTAQAWIHQILADPAH